MSFTFEYARSDSKNRMLAYLIRLRSALKFWDNYPGHRSNKKVRIQSEIERIERAYPDSASH